MKVAKKEKKTFRKRRSRKSLKGLRRSSTESKTRSRADVGRREADLRSDLSRDAGRIFHSRGSSVQSDWRPEGLSRRGQGLELFRFQPGLQGAGLGGDVHRLRRRFLASLRAPSDESKQLRDSIELYDSEKKQSYWWNRWDRKEKGKSENKDFYPMDPFPQDSLSFDLLPSHGAAQDRRDDQISGHVRG